MEGRYFLGVDVGATKTHALLADEDGRVVGFGEGGAGNHEVVGYDGLKAVLRTVTDQALSSAGLAAQQIAGAGFGVGGYDWPSERPATLAAIASLGLQAPVDAVNDAALGVFAGSVEGWGVAVVSGTGCNCRGWDRQRQREGAVTGHSFWMGEGAGGSELVFKAVQAVAHQWTRRGPATQLTPAFLRLTGAHDLSDLLEGLIERRYELGAPAAPLVFAVAEAGDEVARQVVRWAGCELGELAKAVIRQLEFETLAFDLVLIGSMFDGGAMLVDPMRQTVLELAPRARFVRLQAPPVTGAVLLGMQAAGIRPEPEVHARLVQSQGTLVYL